MVRFKTDREQLHRRVDRLHLLASTLDVYEDNTAAWREIEQRATDIANQAGSIRRVIEREDLNVQPR